MGANPHSINTPGMQRAAGAFESAVGESSTTLNRMRGEIASLGVAWTGSASTVFGQALNRWCEEYQNIIKQLHVMHAALESNRVLYDRTEAEVEQQVGALNMPELGV